MCATLLAVLAVGAGPARAAGPMPFFQLPFPCGETWQLATYVGHGAYNIDMTFTGGGSSGRTIVAPFGGAVASKGTTPLGGNYVKLDHGNGWRTTYYHLIEQSPLGVGQQVIGGQPIARVGSTGNSTGPHLHYEVSRDGVNTEAWFNGVPSGINEGASPRNVTSANCGSAAGQVYEAASNNGWRPQAVSGAAGPVTGVATAAIGLNGAKILYSLNGGMIFEAASSNGWRNLHTGVVGAQGTALAALNVNGVKLIYNVVDGYVHEAASNNAWRNLNTGIGGVANNSIAAIQVSGVKYIYSIVGGYVHEASSANGWRNLNTGVPGSAVAAMTVGTTKILYVLNGGSVYEASSASGWANNWTGISGIPTNTIAATNLNGVKLIYTTVGGYVHEAASNNAWRNLNTNVGGTRISVLTLSGVKYLYAS
ncbi:M23 family metallopeptidase [Catellatospora vulcania]|uniref:M23 family metallopeptidase n=1 Tax=Catellatospora vulcania TaxID=1460450 RepID=UPI001E5FB7F0|nr:M23 family metallopeptidase [Catellatospora vulcania]